MSAILGDDIFKWIFLNENGRIPIQISLKFVPRGSIDNKPALVQVMARHRTGDKQFPEPMLTQITEEYMRHLGGWVKLFIVSHIESIVDTIERVKSMYMENESAWVIGKNITLFQTWK